MDRRQFTLATAALGASAVAGVTLPAAADERTDGELEPAAPKYFGYYRVWNDTTAKDSDGLTSMAQIPPEVDLVFAFAEVTAEDEGDFPTTLSTDYVQALHAQGTQVVGTVFVDKLLDPDYPNTDEGHRRLAEHLVATYVSDLGLDGLDIDVERDFTEEELERARGVFTHLSAQLGPRSGTSRLLIYDTNQDGDTALFAHAADLVDYVLVQSYGRSVDGLQATWETYQDLIDPSQYLIGFSFYEERGATWGDVDQPIEASRAYAYAQWQPDGARKGGIFCYALDRDGVAEGDDDMQQTDYSWSTALKDVMVQES
ncbi:MAG TPA: hypothetical protein VK039_05030 [Brevibacterium sp.]|nr:hypothetical protein [Brevibacterium sp.]